MESPIVLPDSKKDVMQVGGAVMEKVSKAGCPQDFAAV
jgi:hypothetical protein